MKKLIPAICMLLVSAVLLGSSTFAWFSMNKTVNANNMTITAVSDNKFLQISTNSETFTDPAKEATAAVNTAALKPVTYSADELTMVDTITKTNWGYAVSSNPAEVQKDNTLTAVETADVDDYYLKNTFYVKTAANTPDGTNLTLKAATIVPGSNSLSSALRIRIVCGANAITYDYSDADTIPTDVLLAIVGKTATAIDVYMYFDGKDDSVYTNNATDLTGVKASLEFQIA